MPPAAAGGDRAVRGQEVATDAAARPMLLFPDLPGLGATRPADAGDAVAVLASVRGDRARLAEVRALVVAGAQPLPEAVGRRRGRRAPQATSPIGVHRPSPLYARGP